MKVIKIVLTEVCAIITNYSSLELEDFYFEYNRMILHIDYVTYILMRNKSAVWFLKDGGELSKRTYERLNRVKAGERGKAMAQYDFLPEEHFSRLKQHTPSKRNKGSDRVAVTVSAVPKATAVGTGSEIVISQIDDDDSDEEGNVPVQRIPTTKISTTQVPVKKTTMIKSCFKSVWDRKGIGTLILFL